MPVSALRPRCVCALRVWRAQLQSQHATHLLAAAFSLSLSAVWSQFITADDGDGLYTTALVHCVSRAARNVSLMGRTSAFGIGGGEGDGD